MEGVMRLIVAKIGPLGSSLLALAIVAACEPQNAQSTRGPTPGSTAPAVSPAATAIESGGSGGGGTSPGASGGSGSPPAASEASITEGTAIVTTTGSIVQVKGIGSVLNSPLFVLSGNVQMKVSVVCGAKAGTFPFVWVYPEFGQLVGQYVDEVNHLKKLSGKYYVTTSADPGCLWTIDFTPE
jgi:hypothetical protein